MKVKLLVDDVGYAQDGTVGPLPAGTVVEVTSADAEPWPFWHRMIRAGRAEVLPDVEPAAPAELGAPVEVTSEEAPKRRGRPPLPRDAEGKPIRI